MKISILKYTLFMLILGLVACDEEANVPEDESQAKALAGPWSMGSNSQVLRDGTDITPQYGDFSIVFTEQFGYFVSGDPNNLLQPEGTWAYAEGSFTSILLNGDLRPINVVHSDDGSALTITFSNDTNVPIGARTAGISGSYTFVLKKG
ncbi:hypothetical protein [Reichenbachiella sp.]|uniref:hypothetical protein n=1 Tax=Reichenbachiella sp. TaxID=2184521 RepID=UPI00329943B8